MYVMRMSENNRVAAFGGTRASRRAGRRGLSIAEVMISLTISTFLLVAVAAAYNASADAVEMNDKFFRATQAGRVTMNQLLTEIRRADSVNVQDPSPTLPNLVQVIRPEPSRLPYETYRTFWYDQQNKQVKLQIHYVPPLPQLPYDSPWYTLSRNVDSALFGRAELQQDTNGTWVVTRVPVQLTVKIGNNQVRLSGSSGPRRAAKE